MSFIVHEDELWPVVAIVASGHFSIRQHVESLKQWNKWLARNETFYVIRLFLDNEATQHTPDIGESTTKWMQNGASKKIKNTVGAMLLVVPDAQYDESKAIHKIFGVPGGMFPSVAAAHTYLQSLPDFDDEILASKVSKRALENMITKSIACKVATKN